MSEQGTTAQAKDKAQEVAGQAQEKAQEAVGQARDRVRTQIDERSSTAGQRVSSHASDLRSIGEQLRQQGNDQPARLADQTADRLERAGSWLSESDADRILHDVEDFARSNPWAVMAGGMALGFAASRLLKASSHDRYEQRSREGSIASRPALPRQSTGQQRFTRPVASEPMPEGIAAPDRPVSTPVPPAPPIPPIPPTSGPGAA
ncbi:MAG TPA: hypothetical protein VFT50_04275 [Baekduia sp.]|nr:hypothetical protein [Baekduia sp.]